MGGIARRFREQRRAVTWALFPPAAVVLSRVRLDCALQEAAGRAYVVAAVRAGCGWADPVPAERFAVALADEIGPGARRWALAHGHRDGRRCRAWLDLLERRGRWVGWRWRLLAAGLVAAGVPGRKTLENGLWPDPVPGWVDAVWPADPVNNSSPGQQAGRERAGG